MLLPQPLYKHDCSRCAYLGRYDYKGDTYDLYACRQAGIADTIVARWSDEGRDYLSGLPTVEFFREHPEYPTCEGIKRMKQVVTP